MGIQTKCVVFIIALGLLLAVTSCWILTSSHDELIEQEAVRIAEIVSTQVLADRAEYTSSLVGKLKKDGTGGARDSDQRAGYIPLPAQFVRNVSERVKQSAGNLYRYSLRSQWNLNEDQGLKDDFDRWGWEQLLAQDREIAKTGKSSWEPVYRFESAGGETVLRFMRADPAAAPACVNCHNEFERRPAVIALRNSQGVASGKQWKLDELMGAIRVEVPVGEVAALAEAGRNQMLGALAGLLAGGLGLLFFMLKRGVIEPIGRTVEVLEAVAAGDYPLQVEAGEAQDEVGRMSRSVNQMVRRVGEVIDESAELSSVLESSASCMMLATADLEISYLNKAAVDAMRRIESALPCGANEMVGKPLDLFFRDSTEASRILSDPANLPHSGELKVADEILGFGISATYDRKGRYTGPLASFAVTTEKVAATERAEQLSRQQQEADQRERLQAEELRVKVQGILGTVTQAADGDLTSEITVTGDDAPGQIAQGLRKFFAQLRGSVENLSQSANALGSSSNQLTAVSQQMAVNTAETSSKATLACETSEQVARNVQAVKSGTEEMAESIQEISKSFNEAARVAQKAVEMAEGTNATIARLGDSSGEIGKVVNVITSIAEQTNLLALNATIEAARAGEAGKGFAVVANEVKELAKETAKATEDISRKIEVIQNDTSSAVTAIGDVTTIINQINHIWLSTLL